MGMPANRRTVRAMLRRWIDDEARLMDMVGGPVTTEDLTYPGEVLRNLGTAIANAQAYVNRNPKL